MRGTTRRARWVSATTTAACLALVLCACGGNTSTGSASPKAGGGIILAAGMEPQNPLLPTNTNEAGGGLIMSLLFQGLISYDSHGKSINQVAASITTTDSQTFTIKVKAGWTFTNGEPVNARSFVDAWNFGALSTNNQLNAYFFEPIEGYAEVHPVGDAQPTARTMNGLVVINSSTFTVRLATAQASFPSRLGYTAFYPLPQSAYKNLKAFGEHPIGNGSYMLDGNWVHNVSIKVKRNPTYKGTLVAKNAGVDVKVYTDQIQSYADLLANDVDVVQGIPDGVLDSFKADLGSRAINQPSGTTDSLTFPLYQPEWNTASSKQVRQAISMAIDRQTITKTVLQGTSTPATDFSSPVVQGYSKDICGEFCAFNPAKAKALLAAAGGFKGTLEIAYNTDGGHKAWVEATCNSIKATLGIDCSARAYPDRKSLRDPITKGSMKVAFRTSWQMDYPALEDFLAPIFAKGAGSNDAHYDNPSFDDLLQEGDKATTPADAIKSYQAGEKLLVTDMPVIPLWYANTTGGYSENVSNVKFDVFGVPIFTDITRK
jgi:ABC-type oligopeptide transport system substrate-binding subunit